MLENISFYINNNANIIKCYLIFITIKEKYNEIHPN